jgi:hypothetical protein
MTLVTRTFSCVCIFILSEVFLLTAHANPVFPGAVGFGVDTPAGKGGAIIRVTNLDAAGPGSLRAALETPGRRIVVFEVAGVVDLGQRGVAIREPFLTVAGQTAPGPGITIIKGGFSIATHDVLIQHIRIRPGDANQAKRSGWAPDGISASGGNAYNIVIDHCSITWAVDENLSASGPRTEGPEATSHRITFSNNIIAEGLDDSSHPKGRHSKGTLIHDCCTDIAVIGNLYAHNDQRNPYFKAHTTGVVVNNVIYNPGHSAIKMNYVKSEWKGASFPPENGRVSVVGNVLISGENTPRLLTMVGTVGDAYLEDNVAMDKSGVPRSIKSRGITVLTEKPVWPERLEALPSDQAVDHVLRNAGARPGKRDAIDKRIIQNFINREGRHIDSQDEVGGYPVIEPVSMPLDIPEDVDAWLAELADDLE